MIEIRDGIRVLSNFTGWLIGADGRIKEVVKACNLVNTAGLQHIVDQLYSSPVQAKMGYYAIGTGTNNPAAGDTALQTEIARIALDPMIKAGVDLSYIGAFGPGQGTGNITEGGIFNAATAGVMLARVKFTAVSKTASDTFIITHKITASAV